MDLTLLAKATSRPAFFAPFRNQLQATIQPWKGASNLPGSVTWSGCRRQSSLAQLAASVLGRTLCRTYEPVHKKHHLIRGIMTSPPLSQASNGAAAEDMNFADTASPERNIKLELAALKQDKWGWVIYRCTYSEDLDATWARFRQLVEERSRQSIAASDTPEVAETLEWTFVDDRAALDSASPQQLRQRFRAWAAEAEGAENARNKPKGHFHGSRYRYFVQVDEAALRSMQVGDNAHVDLHEGWVNLVDSQWEGNPDHAAADDMEPVYGCTEEVVGWMRIAGSMVSPSFYDTLGEDDETWHACYARPPDVCIH